MESVSNWYEPHHFQLVKLLLLTVSLANLAASLMALICHLLPCTSNTWFVKKNISIDSSPLFKVRTSHTFVIGGGLPHSRPPAPPPDGHSGQAGRAGWAAGGPAPWSCHAHHRRRQLADRRTLQGGTESKLELNYNLVKIASVQIHNEKKLLDFETFEYYNTSDEETDEDPNVQPSRAEGRDRNTSDRLISGGTIRPDNPSVDAVDSQ